MKYKYDALTAASQIVKNFGWGPHFVSLLVDHIEEFRKEFEIEKTTKDGYLFYQFLKSKAAGVDRYRGSEGPWDFAAELCLAEEEEQSPPEDAPTFRIPTPEEVDEKVGIDLSTETEARRIVTAMLEGQTSIRATEGISKLVAPRLEKAFDAKGWRLKFQHGTWWVWYDKRKDSDQTA